MVSIMYLWIFNISILNIITDSYLFYQNRILYLFLFLLASFYLHEWIIHRWNLNWIIYITYVYSYTTSKIYNGFY